MQHLQLQMPLRMHIPASSRWSTNARSKSYISDQ